MMRLVKDLHTVVSISQTYIANKFWRQAVARHECDGALVEELGPFSHCCDYYKKQGR